LKMMKSNAAQYHSGVQGNRSLRVGIFVEHR
jgi:hypothetical protein